MAEIIPGLPFPAYRTLSGNNASALKKLLISPRAYKSRRGGDESSDALILGQAVHTAVLEPDEFDERYITWPQSYGRRYGKKWEDFKISNSPREILREKDYEHACDLRDSVRTDPLAMRYLRQVGDAELTITWEDERTGLNCKARMDWAAQDAWVDLKTTRAMTPDQFVRDAFKPLYSYILQAAFYSDGATAAFGERRPFKFLTVQKDPPHDVIVYNVPDDALDYGRRQYQATMDLLIQCKERNDWPGAADGQELQLDIPSGAAAAFLAAEELTLGGVSIEF